MQPYPPPPPPPPQKSNVVWIVLAIVGGVLALAVIIFVMTARSMSYMKKAKRSEADLNLDLIKKLVKAQIPDRAGFVVGSAPLTPSEPCCESNRPDKKCEVEPSQWEVPPWSDLDFRIDDPHFYQYSYEGTAEHFVARAVGDLDCDYEMATYTLEGNFNDGNPTFELTKPARPD